MNRYIAILGFSTALAFSAQAVAHEEDSHRIEFDRVGDFSDIDANQDGKISEKEYMSYREDSRRYDKDWRKGHWAEMTEKFDENDDNQIEVAEIERYAETRVAEVMENLKGLHGNWVGEFDFDSDEFFDDREFELRLEERLEGVHDRVAEAMERLHEREDHLSRWEFAFEDLPDMHGFAFVGPRKFILHQRDGIVLEKMDADDDGKVSKEEFLQSRQDLFARLDENQDGVLDEDEMKDFSWKGNYAFSWHEDEEDEDEE